MILNNHGFDCLRSLLFVCFWFLVFLCGFFFFFFFWGGGGGYYLFIYLKLKKNKIGNSLHRRERGRVAQWCKWSCEARSACDQSPSVCHCFVYIQIKNILVAKVIIHKNVLNSLLNKFK